MKNRGKKYVEAVSKIEKGKAYTKEEAAKLVKETSVSKFVSSVEIAVRLNLDTKKADQQLRGAIVLPKGTGKTKRVLVIARGPKAQEARDAGADLAMLDTAVKDGHTLFDYLDIDDCKKFTEEAHSYGLKVALAGSVKKDQLKPLYDIGCDVVGVRGAACVGGDRNTGHIDRTAVAELKELVKSFEE